MSSQKLNKTEEKVLAFLAESYEADLNCWYMRGIAKEIGLTEIQAKRAVRSLARKGYAKLERGLMDDDGMVAGSGYRATREGAMVILACVDCQVNISSMTDGRCINCWESRLCKKCGKPYREHKLVNGFMQEFEFDEVEVKKVK